VTLAHEVRNRGQGIVLLDLQVLDVIAIQDACVVLRAPGEASDLCPDTIMYRERLQGCCNPGGFGGHLDEVPPRPGSGQAPLHQPGLSRGDLARGLEGGGGLGLPGHVHLQEGGAVGVDELMTERQRERVLSGAAGHAYIDESVVTAVGEGHEETFGGLGDRRVQASDVRVSDDRILFPGHEHDRRGDPGVLVPPRDPGGHGDARQETVLLLSQQPDRGPASEGVAHHQG
jgi:hypothetical protein